ncbi:hypothetical protein [Streptomyces sp. NBC_01171]|uniref:hypothetical protein n=1 Tax=Streptomyces sp. NBC_01171 TaxID=2903757 RepID=UPI00386CADC5|nr:hypothetical protein OG448_00025 [Streptomyces sp. NBC_01171]WST06129.1 hypothetical protein OG448_30540 [Streptomyces sp. NBC_01171]
MSYDIMLVRVQPGLTLQGTLDHLNANFDPDADLQPLRLTQAQRSAWDRILSRVSRDTGPVESAEYPYSLTLETVGRPGRVGAQRMNGLMRGHAKAELPGVAYAGGLVTTTPLRSGARTKSPLLSWTSSSGRAGRL